MQRMTLVAFLSLALCTFGSWASDRMPDIKEYDVPLSPRSYIGSFPSEDINISEIISSQQVNNKLALDPKKDLYYREFDSFEKAREYNTAYRQEKIIGAADRREILGEKVFKAPWNCIFYLEIYYKNVKGKSRTYYGSAILIDYSTLLTAGHNLYDEDDGGYPDQIDCFGACFRNKVLAEATVFPVTSPASVFVPQKFINHKEKDSDIGLVFFESDKTADIMKEKIGTVARPVDYLRLKDKVQDVEFYIGGYPGERKAHAMGGKVTLASESTTLLHYDIDTQPGQSGSGIWFKTKKEVFPLCIGVHAYAGQDKEKFNVGVLITDDIKEMLSKRSSSTKEKK